MPNLDAHKFIARVANDDGLIMRLVTGSDAEIQRIAGNMGLSFSPAELQSALRRTLETTELSAAELDTVVGGASLAPGQHGRLGRLLTRLDDDEPLNPDQIRSR